MLRATENTVNLAFGVHLVPSLPEEVKLISCLFHLNTVLDLSKVLSGHYVLWKRNLSYRIWRGKKLTDRMVDLGGCQALLPGNKRQDKKKGLELHQQMFRLDIGKISSLKGLLSPGTGGQGVVESPSLEEFTGLVVV